MREVKSGKTVEMSQDGRRSERATPQVNERRATSARGAEPSQERPDGAAHPRATAVTRSSRGDLPRSSQSRRSAERRCSWAVGGALQPSRIDGPRARPWRRSADRLGPSRTGTHSGRIKAPARSRKGWDRHWVHRDASAGYRPGARWAARREPGNALESRA